MTLRSLQALADAHLISAADADALAPVAAAYAIGLTAHLAAQINRDDPHDPIARSFLPTLAELQSKAEERRDPIGDLAHSPVPFLVHRYPDRVLLMPTPVCPVYCRFCFLREAVGPQKGETPDTEDLDAAIAYIAAHTEIREVIFTGGDPFMLSAARVGALTRRLGALAHIQILRWHTRMPVADPARITPDFVAALGVSGKAVYVGMHINHRAEFSPETRAATDRLIDAGIPVLSQTVLLRGVNDSLAALSDLFGALVGGRVRPYYLHHPDLAPGTSHFRVTIAEGQALYQALRDSMSGLCLPHYVLDIPGGVSKANAAPSDVQVNDTGARLRGRDNTWHDYPAG
jgi:lysine 2,3-aminomutase